ncbi:MAG: hypothetical protein JKX97_02695 [Candidatus Lindowbacteria bacterium]|nr:hypothetical protein [Candidatus Lindowbacteria bacterium]
MTKVNISKTTTMDEIQNAWPTAKEFLFQKYHLGGCSSCAFHPDESLEQVLLRADVTDVDAAIAELSATRDNYFETLIDPAELEDLRQKDGLKLVDVRQEEEQQLVSISGSIPATQELVEEMQSWPRDATIVLYCHMGDKSPEAGSYLRAEHGFTNVKTLRGGINAWSKEIDPFIPIY